MKGQLLRMVAALTIQTVLTAKAARARKRAEIEEATANTLEQFAAMLTGVIAGAPSTPPASATAEK